MTDNTLGLRSTSALCGHLRIDEPKQELIKHNFSLFHKILQTKQPADIINKLIIPKRRTSKIYVKGSRNTQRSMRSPIHAGVTLYNAMPAEIKQLPHKMMICRLRKVDINYSLFK